MNPIAAADCTPGHQHSRPVARAACTAAAARRRVTELLRAAGAALDGTAAGDALLVASELVTNAIRHGGGITAFHAALDGDTLRLAVSDANPEPPAARSTGQGHPGGYGWPLVRRLTDHVDITLLSGGGKTITAVQRLTAFQA
ncbi:MULTISPECIES: ATP-binding protein [unclassified Streptomyces]|uniref:ATP-binding protein n=1 Tax=unclassified Streptomyces TaxID=2593676 RepID=UPI00365E94CF